MYGYCMKVILAVCMTLACLPSVAQNAPDNEDILAKTIDPDSPYYYPSLMLRYTNGDETLSEKDYYYLYYGYAYSDSYRPLESIPAEMKVLEVLERSQDDPTVYDMQEMIRYAGEVMKADPFSPSNLNLLVYAYGMIGDTVNERLNYDRMNKVLATIRNSGTGLTESSPMHVLRFSHASDLLGSYGLEVTNRMIVSRTAEYISVSQDGRPQRKGYYFDYSRVYWRKPDGTASATN